MVRCTDGQRKMQRDGIDKRSPRSRFYYRYFALEFFVNSLIPDHCSMPPFAAQLAQATLLGVFANTFVLFRLAGALAFPLPFFVVPLPKSLFFFASANPSPILYISG